MRCSTPSLRLASTPGIEVARSTWWSGMRNTRWEKPTTFDFAGRRAGRAGRPLGVKSFASRDACASSLALIASLEVLLASSQVTVASASVARAATPLAMATAISIFSAVLNPLTVLAW
jgi:hypothetical protein